MSCRACSLKVSQQQWEFSRRQAKIFERRSPSNFKSNTLTTQKCKKAVIKRQERGTTFFSFFFFLPLRTGLHISTMNSEHTAHGRTGRQGEKKCSSPTIVSILQAWNCIKRLPQLYIHKLPTSKDLLLPYHNLN